MQSSAKRKKVASSLACELLWLPVIADWQDFLRKEVIQPQVPLRLPCYDLVPIIELAVGASLLDGWVSDFGCTRLG